MIAVSHRSPEECRFANASVALTRRRGDARIQFLGARMPSRRTAATLALVLAAGPFPAHAFSPATRVELARRAVTLMPPSLARQLTKHDATLIEGVLEGMGSCSGSGDHAVDPGAADVRLAAAIDEAIALVGRRARMAEVANALGRAAHAAMDLAFALNSGPDDPRERSYYREYALYVEKMLPRVRLTFPGWADSDLARRDVTAFAHRVAADARRDAAGIARSYYPEGRSRLAQDFDERSVAFATASLGSSLALTSVARAWLFAWWRANGDLSGTPHLDAGLVHNPFLFPAGGSSPPPRQESRR